MSNYLFLLGGYDLEMIEIKKILEQQKQDYKDKKLRWGAKLSDYQEYFDTNKTIVAIELQNDITPPLNFINIDHHNDDANKPSSIEQVANLLNIELNEDQKLVAINDYAHIKGLKKAGASKEKIDEIRLRDRSAQGVTQEDENLALESLKEKKYINDVCIVKAKTSKFSTITDRLDEKNLIVYNNSELNYYGVNRDKIVKKYQDYIYKNKAYYGGSFDGFFGFSENVLNKDDIEKVVNEIVEECLKK